MLNPEIVHELPSASSFVGREKELEKLEEFRHSPFGVLSLVGIGGSGKTSILRKFLDDTLKDNSFDGVFVWSFYDDPDTNSFLRFAVEYITGSLTAEVSGAGWFHTLRRALEDAGRFLFVLDGLERVQREHTDGSGIYGEIEDPLLRGFLSRIVTGSSNSLALITSRFPVSDLEKWLGRGYTIVDIDHLDVKNALQLFHLHGVEAEEASLIKVFRSYGRHALTTDLLGSVIKRFFGGKIDGLPEPPEDWDQQDGEAGPLSFVLSIFQKRLSLNEQDLVNRLCVFRFGVGIETLHDVFLRDEDSAGSLANLSIKELAELCEDLVQTHLVHREEEGKLTVHPAVRDHFYKLFRDAVAIHGAVTDHLISLSGRPGIGLPTSKDSLDMLEELVHHALRADRPQYALEIFNYRLGGNEHLNTTLGEYARTYRILSAFPENPSKGAMYHSLRAFGEYEEALKWRPQNRYILIAQGKLRDLKDDPSEMTRRAVRFLMGESTAVPERMADFPISAAHLHLLASSVGGAEAAAVNEITVALYQDDIVRAKLGLAEVARRKNQYSLASERLDEVGPWVLRSGSHEHLFFLYLYRARLSLSLGQLQSARMNFEEALRISEASSFDLLKVEATAGMSQVETLVNDFDRALEFGQEATDLAHELAYPWGEIMGQHALAEAHLAAEDIPSAFLSYKRELDLQKRIGDPNSGRTELAINKLTLSGTR